MLDKINFNLIAQMFFTFIFSMIVLIILIELFNGLIRKIKCKFLKKPYFNKDQQEIIDKARKNGLSEEQIALIANPSFNQFQMDVVYKGFVEGFNLEEIESYAKADYDHKQMNQIYYGYNSYDVKAEDVERFCSPEFGEDQLGIIIDALGKYSKLTKEEVETFAKPCYSVWEMKRALKEITEEKLKTENK